MLLALIVCHMSVLVIANPFHKYPIVFLLDVGNEELEKTNTEQIRLSVPGGSVALRYPAIGDGNTIGHLRVSSIDFGTAFKANIVDGGPGYKYAVLVFMGSPGVPFDAVVTVKTVDDQVFFAPNIGFTPNTGGVEVEEDANNSAEDLSDDGPQPSNYQSENIAQNGNAELTQSSEHVYKYAKNEVMEQSDNYDDTSDPEGNNNDGSNDELDVEADDNEESEGEGENEGNDENNESDIHKEYTDDIDQIDDSNVQVKGIDTDDADNDEESSPELAQSVPIDYEEDNEESNVDRSRINSNYDGLRPFLSRGEVRYEDTDERRPDYQQEPLDYESPDEIQQLFNDGEQHNVGSDSEKYRDSNNNNYIDADDNFAVAY